MERQYCKFAGGRYGQKMERNYKVFIVEDDEQTAVLLKEYLTKYQYDVVLCENFSNVLEECKSAAPHIIIMDINLPAFDVFLGVKKSVCGLIVLCYFFDEGYRYGLGLYNGKRWR